MPNGLWNFYRDGVTASFLNCWQACHERAYLTFVEGIERPSFNRALYLGSLVHGILERHYDGRSATAEELLPEVRASLLPLGSVNVDADECDLQAVAMVENYCAFWKRDDKRVQWLATEHQFRIPFPLRSGTTTFLRGRIDGVFRRGREVWLLETKTASQIDDSALTDRLAYDLQVNLYLLAVARLHNLTPTGVIYNLLRKPQLRQGKHETNGEFAQRYRADIEARPDWYFWRYEIRITEREQQFFVDELTDVLADVERWFAGHGQYRTSAACENKYGVCPYLPVCGRDDRTGFVPRSQVFAELD